VNLSTLTAVFSGQSASARQSGISLSSDTGSITAPDRMWAPTSDPLLHHDDRQIGIKLLQPDRGGEAGRPGADDHNSRIPSIRAGGILVLMI